MTKKKLNIPNSNVSIKPYKPVTIENPLLDHQVQTEFKSYLAFKLAFTTPLHISRGGEDYEKSLTVLHSDTIKSALYVMHRQLNDNPLDVKDFFDAFSISSAFPFYKDEYFFPKPFGIKLPQLEGEQEGDSKNAKKYKKVSYVAKGHFERMINGNAGNCIENKIISKGEFLADGNYSLEPELNPIIMTKATQSRVSISRTGMEDPTPYDVERIYFGAGAGLYFLVQFNEGAELNMEQLKSCIDLLGDTGVGTDKSVGNGQFEVSKHTIYLNVPTENISHHMALGLYCPEKVEIADSLDNWNYSLIQRGGWLSNPENQADSTLHKSSVHMMLEGSLVPNAINPVGKYADLAPTKNYNHPVLREGRPMFIPVIA